MTLSWEPLVTLEQLGRLPSMDRKCELVDGRIVERSPVHGGHGRVAARMLRALVLWAADRDAGEVLSAATGFILRRNPDTVRVPDVSFVRKGRQVPAHAFIERAPDVAVEVLDHSESHRDADARVRDYLDGGAAQVWIVDMEERSLTVHALHVRPVTLGRSDVLDGGGVLPDFRLPVRRLFAD